MATATLLTVTAAPLSAQQTDDMMELGTTTKTIYPANIGLSDNETMLNFFQVVPELLYDTKGNTMSDITLKIDGIKNSANQDVLLRTLRVMDVEKIVIKSNPGATSTAGTGQEVNIVLKKRPKGEKNLGGVAAADVSTGGMQSPTVKLNWASKKWAIDGNVSLYNNSDITDSWTTTYPYSDQHARSVRTDQNREHIFSKDISENVFLRTIFSPTTKDNIELRLIQNYQHLKVTDNYHLDNVAEYMQTAQDNNDNQIILKYEHTFQPGSSIVIEGGATFDSNPLDYRDVIHDKGIAADDINRIKLDEKVSQKVYYAEFCGSFALRDNVSLDITEHCEWAKTHDDYKVKYYNGEGVGRMYIDYQYNSFNSQTCAQFAWTLGKWKFELGGVVDVFKYEMALGSIFSTKFSYTTPQGYFAIGNKLDSHNAINLSFRSVTLRPSYMQYYPPTIDVNDPKLVDVDNHYNALNNAGGYRINADWAHTRKDFSITAGLSTLIVNDKPVKAMNPYTYENSGQDIITRANVSSFFQYGIMSMTLGLNGGLTAYRDTPAEDYSYKLNFNVRWMSSFNLGKGWTAGTTMLYNTHETMSDTRTADYIYADIHAAWNYRRWTFTANLSDIFDQNIIDTSWTNESTTVIEQDLNKRILTIGAIFRF